MNLIRLKNTCYAGLVWILRRWFDSEVIPAPWGDERECEIWFPATGRRWTVNLDGPRGCRIMRSEQRAPAEHL